MRFLLFIMLQVYVLDKIPHLHQFITPYIYFFVPSLVCHSVFPELALLIVILLLVWCLIFYDDTRSPCCSLCIGSLWTSFRVINVLYQRFFRIQLSGSLRSSHSAGRQYLVYIFVLTLVASWLLNLAGMACLLVPFLQFLIKIVATTAISMLLIITTELLFPRRMKFRTNTAIVQRCSLSLRFGQRCSLQKIFLNQKYIANLTFGKRKGSSYFVFD